MNITMYGDGNQAGKTQSNYMAGKFCNTCSQMTTTRCTKAIMAAASTSKADDIEAAAFAQTVLEGLSLCWAFVESAPNDRSRSTCNKYGIGTSVT